MSQAIALVGDWNATPRDRGRWSPAWLAKTTGLTLRSAGPGRHGDIDYPIADCHLVALERHPPPGGASRSDHDVVTFLASLPRQPDMVVGTWNLLHGRAPSTVALQVAGVLFAHDLDVLVCQEAAEYHRHLEAIPGYRLIAYEEPGAMHNVILVRETLAVHRPRLVRLSPLGWRTVTGGTHAPLYATSVVVDWLRVVCVHQPPSVNWKGGRIYGPPMRVAAYAHAAGRLARWTKANRKHRQ